MSTIRLLLSIGTQFGGKVHDMDVKSAFLNGELQEVYMTQPLSFKVTDKDHEVCRLQKVLYGHKQAPRGWLLMVFSVVLLTTILCQIPS